MTGLLLFDKKSFKIGFQQHTVFKTGRGKSKGLVGELRLDLVADVNCCVVMFRLVLMHSFFDVVCLKLLVFYSSLLLDGSSEVMMVR